MGLSRNQGYLIPPRATYLREAEQSRPWCPHFTHWQNPKRGRLNQPILDDTVLRMGSLVRQIAQLQLAAHETHYSTDRNMQGRSFAIHNWSSSAYS